MKLRSDRTLWPTISPQPQSYPPLSADITCDVVIVGGGIIGSLLAYYLSAKELTVVVIDKNRIARASTSASTALLLYELDIELVTLQEQLGTRRAQQAYRLSLASLKTIKKLIRKLHIDCDYQAKKSLYVASKKADVPLLKREYAARQHMGIAVRYLDQKTLHEEYRLNAEGAILSQDAGVINPFAFSHALIRHATGVQVFEHTECTDIKKQSANYTVSTNTQHTITAKHVVLSTGYESYTYLPKELVTLKSSYVLASKPGVSAQTPLLKEHVIWETARPYLYIRTSADNRVIVGGADVPVLDADKRDQLIPEKTAELKKGYAALISPEEQLSLDFAWAGTFGETKDGLGYIGHTQGKPHLYYALGFGGNGITFGVIAAEMIAALIQGKTPPGLSLFALDRTKS